jgi:O-antigen ligase
MALWIVAVLFTLDAPAFLHSLRRPAAALPILFFALVLAGTLWADGPWAARLRGINPAVKLLAIPLLLYHFERSQRGIWVLAAFIVSCTLLMTLSCIVALEPGWRLGSAVTRGIAVKNYLDQSQEFTFCLFALALPTLWLIQQKRYALAAGCVVLMLGFFANMIFVVTGRTALVCIPVLLALFAIRQFSIRTTTILFAIVSALVVTAWFASPYLRQRVDDTISDYRHYQQDGMTYQSPSSSAPEYLRNPTGLRLEYWRKSLKFFGDAPILGHGTGMIRQLFERDAVGKTDLAAEVVDNPHNQTLNVAVQWGAAGIILLYAMWLAHLRLLRGTSAAAWIGLLIVVQNFISSLFNSHLFDFVEGWMYVLGVGIAGGITLAGKARKSNAPP